MENNDVFKALNVQTTTLVFRIWAVSVVRHAVARNTKSVCHLNIVPLWFRRGHKEHPWVKAIVEILVLVGFQKIVHMLTIHGTESVATFLSFARVTAVHVHNKTHP
jgi:hypothetical protein